MLVSMMGEYGSSPVELPHYLVLLEQCLFCGVIDLLMLGSELSCVVLEIQPLVAARRFSCASEEPLYMMKETQPPK